MLNLCIWEVISKGKLKKKQRNILVHDVKSNTKNIDTSSIAQDISSILADHEFGTALPAYVYCTAVLSNVTIYWKALSKRAWKFKIVMVRSI